MEALWHAVHIFYSEKILDNVFSTVGSKGEGSLQWGVYDFVGSYA